MKVEKNMLWALVTNKSKRITYDKDEYILVSDIEFADEEAVGAGNIVTEKGTGFAYAIKVGDNVDKNGCAKIYRINFALEEIFNDCYLRFDLAKDDFV